MAELDQKVLNNIDETLKKMNQSLVTLGNTLDSVGEKMQTAFNPIVFKGWKDAMRGLKAERLIKAEENVAEIKKIEAEIERLQMQIDTGRKVIMSSNGAMTLGRTLNKSEIKESEDALAEWNAVHKNIMKGSEQRAIELANLQKAEERDVLNAAKQRYKEEQAARQENINQNKAADAAESARRKQNLADAKAAFAIEQRAVSQQITYQKQLTALRRQYYQLKSKKDRTSEENALLDDTKKKLKEIIGLIREKENSYKGSYNLAKQATEYDRIIEKGKRLNKLHVEHEEHLGKISHSLQHIAGAFGVAFSLHGLVHFGKELVKVRGEYEMQQVALRAIIQNKQVADEIWDKTLKASFQSPFTFLKLSTYTKQLAAYRIETEKLFDTTQMLADVSAGLGVDMQRLILAYGQVKAANYLRASEIRQFTEAGVNILGELSNYFTETRGEMISTAQVMEMVQKRMVKFEDVEAIFQRMTSAGGIFYNMQYIQSQTIQGQLAKLEDAWDHVLNDIGKANEGVIKDLILALRHIIENWRTWAIVIKSIGWSVAIGYVSKYALALSGLQKASTSTLRSIAKLRSGLRSLTTAMVNNPIMAAIVGVTALVTTMVGLHKKMKEVNNEIDEHNMRLYETRRNFEDVKSKIEANNKTLEKAAKGSDKYNAAMAENKSIMQKLLNDYPDLARQMEIFNDSGIIQMNKALDIQIRKLNEEMTIMNAMKQKSWLTDSDKENLEELETNLAVMKRRIASAQHKAMEEMMKIELLPEKEKGSPLNQHLLEFYTKVSKIDLSGNILDAVDALRQLHDEYENFDLGYASSKKLFLYNKLDVDNGLFGLSSDLRAHHSKERGKEALEEQSAFLKDAYEKGIRDNVEYNKEINALATEMMQEEIEKNGKKLTDAQQKIINDKAVTRWISRNIKKINDGTIEGVNKANEIIIKTLGPQSEEMKAFIDDYYNNTWKYIDQSYIKELEQKIAEGKEKLRKGGLLPFEAAEVAKNLKKWEEDLAASLEGVDLFATAASKNQNTGEDPQETQSKIDAAWRRRIQLLEEMKRRYDELSSKAYGYAESEKTVRKEFANIWEKEFGDLLSMSNVSFTSDARMQAAFNKFVELAKTTGKEAGEGVVEELGKNAAKYGAKIPIDIQIRAREDFGREIEKMFGDYELTLELQGLNIPEDAAKNLFPDLNYKTLGDLQDRMLKFYNEQTKGGTILMDEEDLKVYRQWANKVDAEILKSRKEKAKEYSKFLEREYSERAKLEMKHAQDVAFVTANVQDETQRINIVNNINKKYQEDLNELNWKSFKESDFYVQMMDDISSLPAEYTRMMLDKLDEIISKPEKLSPKALKEAIKARNKVLETQIDLAPLEVRDKAKTRMNELWDLMGNNKNKLGWKDWKETQKLAEKEMVNNQEQINVLEKKAEAWDKVTAAIKLYEDAAQVVKTKEGKLDKETLERINNTDAKTVLKQKEAEKKKIQEQIEELQARKDKLSPKEQDELANLISKNQALREQISLINDVIVAETYALQLKQEADAVKQEASESFSESEQAELNETETSTEAESQSQKAKEEADNLKKRNQELEDGVTAYVEYIKSLDSYGKKIQFVMKQSNIFGKSLYGIFKGLGAQTDSVSDAWMKFGDEMTDVLTRAIDWVPRLVEAYKVLKTEMNMSMGVVGLAAEGISLLSAGINAFANLNDANQDEKIKLYQKRIDALKYSYEKLEAAMKRAWSSIDYIQNYDKSVENLRNQQAELRKQISAEKGKKESDSSKIAQYENAIRDIDNQIEQLGKDMIVAFGGLGEDNYTSSAQEFVNAWKDAFLETGDGLQGLQDYFDDFLQEWFVKQATMRVAGKMLEPLFKDIDKAVDRYGYGGTDVLMSELAAVKEKFATIAPDLSDALEALAGQGNLSDEGGLSGLAAGIQGMTEEQANILEAYWNSVRTYTASIDENVSRIAAILGAGGVDTNPQLQQLEMIARNTSAIQSLFGSVVENGHTRGGKGVRVFVG